MCVTLTLISFTKSLQIEKVNYTLWAFHQFKLAFPLRLLPLKVQDLDLFSDFRFPFYSGCIVTYGDIRTKLVDHK